MTRTETRIPNQVVGNTGLYYVCYELSKRGWNVLTTSRNARGVDIVIYDEMASRRRTIQVKSLSKRAPVPLGSDISNLAIADFIVICRQVFDEQPDVFITTFNDIEGLIHRGVKNETVSYWLQPKDYERFRNRWDKIGKGYVGAQDEVDSDVVAQLSRVYATESSALDPVLKALQRQTLSRLPKEDW
jgi:hypothetical protein